MTDQPGSTPAGWYPDPEQPGQMRYWDGALWAPASPPATAAPGSVTSAFGAPALVRTSGFWTRPVVVILSLFFCFPVGLFFMWRGRLWSTPARWLVTAAVAGLLVVGATQQPPPSSPAAGPVGPVQPSTGASTSAQPTTVSTPGLLGSSRAGVAATLAASGLQLGSVTLVHSSQPAGTVLQQQPAPGVALAPGSVVSIVVSSGPLPSPTHAVPTHTAAPPPATHAPAPKPTPTKTKPAVALCGAPANPLGYTFCGGSLIYTPDPTTCDYFNCIPNWSNGVGYMDECRDGTFSMSGGRSGACSHHGGESRPVYHG